jgi:hypothetical protein
MLFNFLSTNPDSIIRQSEELLLLLLPQQHQLIALRNTPHLSLYHTAIHQVLLPLAHHLQPLLRHWARDQRNRALWYAQASPRSHVSTFLRLVYNLLHHVVVRGCDRDVVDGGGWLGQRFGVQWVKGEDQRWLVGGVVLEVVHVHAHVWLKHSVCWEGVWKLGE